MKDLKYWISFTKAEGVGSGFIRKAINHFGSIAEAWNGSIMDYSQLKRQSSKNLELFLNSRKNINPDECFEEIQKRNIKVLTLNDPDYPYLLRQIPDPPAVLYIKGDLESCNLDKTLAIVGPRKASEYILEVLGTFIRGFKDSDLTIVSGMALGVDACAHRNAIKNNLKTIAVLGCGLDVVYPKKNQDIYNNIINGNGAVISEYYPTKKPEPWCFPVRNRIVSGLSKGTLLAEAGFKSGAMITAKIAIDQDRELMCIPGLITNPNTQGVFKLLKEGANMVTTSEDILSTLNWEMKRVLNKTSKDGEKIFLDNEQEIYDILRLEPKRFDEILNQVKMDVDELMVLLMNMELNDTIKQLSAQKYMLVE